MSISVLRSLTVFCHLLSPRLSNISLASQLAGYYIAYSLLFVLRFSVVNLNHPYFRCVQPFPVFSVQHVLPRVMCVRIIIDFISTADIALCLFQPWPIYCSKYFPYKGSKRLPSSWTVSNFRMDSMRCLWPYYCTCMFLPFQVVYVKNRLIEVRVCCMCCFSGSHFIRKSSKVINSKEGRFWEAITRISRSKWPCGLRRRSAASRLMRLQVRMPSRAWMSLVGVVFCQIGVCATSWSLVQRRPTDCDAPLCVFEKPEEWGGPGPRWAAAPRGGTILDIRCFFNIFKTAFESNWFPFQDFNTQIQILYLCILFYASK
jgi:hypothetical protein